MHDLPRLVCSKWNRIWIRSLFIRMHCYFWNRRFGILSSSFEWHCTCDCSVVCQRYIIFAIFIILLLFFYHWFVFFPTVGAILSGLPCSYIAQMYNWRAIFVILQFAAAATALLISVFRHVSPEIKIKTQWFQTQNSGNDVKPNLFVYE